MLARKYVGAVTEHHDVCWIIPQVHSSPVTCLGQLVLLALIAM